MDFGNDATAYGGMNSGIDPAYAGDPSLAGLDSGNFGFGEGLSTDMNFYTPSLFGDDDFSSSMTLGDMYGGGVSNPDSGDFRTGLKDFLNSKFGKGLQMVGGMFPAGRAISGVANLVAGNYGKGLSGLVGGPGGTMLGMAGDMLGGKTNASTFGSMGGGMLGGMAGSAFGPMGSQLGSMFGSQAGGKALSGQQGYMGADASNKAPGAGGGSLDLGQVFAGLASMYGANKMAGDAKQASNAATTGTDAQLESMFGQNSPYAGQLRQELNRRDAAGGRRSQYGPREVELQAKLAAIRAQSEPGIRNANTNAAQQSFNTSTASRLAKQKMLGDLVSMGRSTGAFSGLAGMFGNQQQAPSMGPAISLGDYSSTPGSIGGTAGGNWWDDV